MTDSRHPELDSLGTTVDSQNPRESGPRVILIVMDSVGVGELPDAADYGDAGSNTLAHIAEAVGGLDLPNLAQLGLPLLLGEGRGEVSGEVIGCYGKMAELSQGKDTDTGHWEMMGIVTERAFPTYPQGFPDEIIREFESRIGRKILGNKAASGTVIIQELGDEHMRTGKPIVYTSADSVFQIACHESIVPVEGLYAMCKIARSILVGPHNVQRVIARPFTGASGAYVRTGRRRDFSLPPPGDTLLDHITRAGGEVIGIGKIEDIFSHRGITTSNHTTNNPDSIEATISAIASGQGTLIFTNLVDFDMLYGHRNDAAGYAQALRDFDAAIPRIIAAMTDRDILMITADHGCDPTTPSTDHSREYVPLLVYGKSIAHGVNLGIRSSFCDIAATVADLFVIPGVTCGTSFRVSLFSHEV
jgi:phosphopentomutase